MRFFVFILSFSCLSVFAAAPEGYSLFFSKSETRSSDKTYDSYFTCPVFNPEKKYYFEFYFCIEIRKGSYEY